jgi:multiple sugar transport system permease protein/putative aldouronate transport system permease protein
MAVVVLTLLPITVAFPFLQKHFAEGMLTGAIKG